MDLRLSSSQQDARDLAARFADRKQKMFVG
jgi:hypothetical protein